MPRPPLDARQTAEALEAYHAIREQAVRYVLAILAPETSAAPALPYPEVLVRVCDLMAAERASYAASAEDADAEEPQAAEEPTNG